MAWRIVVVGFLLLLGSPPAPRVQAQNCPDHTAAQRTALINQHLFGGQPSPGAILVRRGYVTQYDATHRVPRWSAWHAHPSYLGTPDREGPWATFRTDPSVPDPVTDDDYTGVGAVNMARGHIVPYFMAGGDRDLDGMKAANAQNGVLDLDDACTVYEINYMTNIAPQFHRDHPGEPAFNDGDGLWYALEERIREEIVGGGVAIWIIAGTIYGDGPTTTVGEGAIPVPHMFFQILITPSGVVPFLFVHTSPIGPHGCALDKELVDCIVAIADIEAITGLDFFSGVDDAFETILQHPDGQLVWQVLTGE
jgi:endonuclease G